MFIKSINLQFNVKNNIEFKGSNSTNKNLYETTLHFATNDVMDYFLKEKEKVQNSCAKFANNWCNQHKAYQLINFMPTNVKFFSEDKSEKITITSKNEAIFEDKNLNKITYIDKKWSGDISGIEDSLIKIINNNVQDGDKKAKLLYSLSAVYLNKLLNEKDLSDLKTINNIHKLFETVTNMYNCKLVEYNANEFFYKNCLEKTDNELKKEGWNISDENFRTFLTLEKDEEFYNFIRNRSRDFLIKYERKVIPLYTLEKSCFGTGYDEIFSDSNGNEYEKSCIYGFFGNSFYNITTNIQGFGKIKCSYNTNSNNIYKYTIEQDNMQPQIYEINTITGAVTKLSKK